jgi:hypothetical protein
MENLTDDERGQIDFYAKIANASYQEPKKRAGYTNIYGLKDKGLIYDADASDKYHAVYIDPKNGKIHMSIRGTQLKHGWGDAVSDLITDFGVALGATHSSRFRKSDDKLKELQAKYPDKQIEVYGHSLGGTIGANLSKKYGVQSHNFSAGSGAIDPNVVFETRLPKNKATARTSFSDFHPEYKERTHYYHVGDFDALSETSMAKAGTHHIYEKKDGLGSHSLQNYFLTSEEK